MKCGSQIAVAVVGGYVLGRSRKTRLAVMLALIAAGGGKLPIGPEDLLRKTPLGGPLDKLTGDLKGQIVDAGMSVAKKAASSRIDSLSDRLQERAESLRGTGGRRAEEAEETEEAPERTRPRRDRGEPSRRRPEGPGRRERDADEPSRRGRTREPEYDEDEYDDYDRDDYDDDYDREDERDEYDTEDERDERSRRERRPQIRSSRPEPRRRAPRRDDDRPRRGRSPR